MIKFAWPVPGSSNDGAGITAWEEAWKMVKNGQRRISIKPSPTSKRLLGAASDSW